jgi:hypothetical protein
VDGGHGGRLRCALADCLREGLFYRKNGLWQELESASEFARLTPRAAFTDWMGRAWFGYEGGTMVILDREKIQKVFPADASHVGSEGRVLRWVQRTDGGCCPRSVRRAVTRPGLVTINAHCSCELHSRTDHGFHSQCRLIRTRINPTGWLLSEPSALAV